MRFLLILSILLGVHFTKGQNLLINPGAELDPVTNGWTQVSGFWESGTEVTARPGGFFHFYAGDNSTAGSEIYQDVNVSSMAASIDAGTSSFTFVSWMRVYNYSFSTGYNDQGRAIVEYRSAASTILTTYDSGLRNNLLWTSYTDVRTAPAGTRTIRIRLIANRTVGTAADGYFDDLSLTHATVLPITLVSFQSRVLQNAVQLTWQTAEEKSNDFFTIERSEDGTAWDSIGTVKGAQDSEQLLSYQWLDATPLTGVQYYRLKQTDTDGKSVYFQIIKANYNISETEELIAYPNPASGIVTLLVSGQGTLRLYTLAGQEIFTKEIAVGNVHSIDVSTIPAGLYRMEYSGSGEITRKILTKE